MKKTLKKLIKPAVVIWFVIAVTGIFVLSPVSVIALVSAVFLILIMPDNIFENMCRPAATAGLLFGLFTSFANYANYSSDVFAVNITKGILYGIGAGFLYYFILCRMYLAKPARIFRKKRQISRTKLFLTVFITVLVIQTVFFLAYFPGIVNEDTIWQFEQATGLAEWSNHHPAAHTFVIGLLYKLGLSVAGTANGGTAAVCIAQMMISSSVFAYSVTTLSAFELPSWLCTGAALMYAFHPLCIMNSFYVTKDLWFAISVLLMLSASLRLVYGKALLRDKLLLAVGALGTGLFRSNGTVVLAVFSVFFAIKFRKELKTALIIPVAAVLCIIITGPVYSAEGIAKVDTVEYLSVPIQQISAVYAEGGRITDINDAEYLNSIVPVYKLAEEYNPHLSDNIKNLIRDEGDQSVISDDIGEFIGLWARTLAKYPDSYIRAYVNQTSGFWYPESSTMSYLTGNPENGLGITTNAVLTGGISDFLRNWSESTRTEVIFAWLFNNGIVAWIMLALLGLASVRGSKARLIFSVPVTVWITLLLSTPVASDNRYIFSVFVSLPILFAAALVNKQKKK